MTLIQRTLPALIAAGVFSVAYGQQPAPAAAPASPAASAGPAIADPTCEQPPTHPMVTRATSKDWDKLNKKITEYASCMKAYADASKGKAEEYQVMSNQYIDAGNKAINTFNAYITEVKKEQEAD